MTIIEAQKLLLRILHEAPNLVIEMHLLDNGDLICRITEPKVYYIWSEADWEQYNGATVPPPTMEVA